jgi:hypothetical protein
MVSLEIIGGHRNVDNTRDFDKLYFPSITFNKAMQDKVEELIKNGLELKRQEGFEEAYRLINDLMVYSKQFNTKDFHGNSGANIKVDLEIMDIRMDTSFVSSTLF